MQQAHVLRTPFPSENEISSLPPIAKNILGMFEGQIEMSDYKELANGLVDANNGREPKFGEAKVRYRNPNLMRVAKKQAGIGEYNPDRIPISTYEKMRLDPQIALGTALIELPILAQNYRIECSNPKIAAVVDACMRPIYKKLVKSMLRAVQFGFATGEKVWEKVKLRIDQEGDDGKNATIYNRYTVVPKKIKFIHPKSVRIIREEKSEDIEYVTQTQDYYDFKGKRVPKVHIKDMVWFALDDEYGNFFGSSRYKNIYQAWYWYQIVVQFMLRYLERRGAPAAVGKAPFGSTTKADGEKIANIDVILDAAYALVSNSAVAIPSQFDKNGNELWNLELIEDEQRGELFLEVLRYLNLLKLRGLFVPDKVGTAEGASTNATTEGHTDVHLLEEEALTQFIEDCLNTQVIPDIVQYNFPPSKIVPCAIKIEKLNYSKRVLMKDVLIRMLMVYSGAMRDGNWPNWLPSVKEISKFLEIPGSESMTQFLPLDIDGGNNDGSNDVSDEESSGDTPSDKKDKIDKNNKDATPRKDRTRRERRSRERA